MREVGDSDPDDEGVWNTVTKKTYPYPACKSIVKWVSTDWLNEHLDDQGIMIIDSQPDLYDYVQQHIPRAFYLSERVLRAFSKGLPARYGYISPEGIQGIARGIGIKKNIPVVVYTSTGAFRVRGDGAEQFMVAYSLARFGHEMVYILDGGLDKWKEEHRMLTKVLPRAEESKFNTKVNHDFFVEYDEFKRLKDESGTLHLDNRSSKYYEGEGPWIRLGHIPGAVSLPWTEFVDEKNSRLLRRDDNLRKMLDKVGATPDKMIIVSCGTGRHSTLPFLALRSYLSYPKVKIYEGSFTEWTSDPANPTVAGKNP